MTELFDEYKSDQARKWLEHVKELGARIKLQKALVDAERELLDGIKGVNYDAMPTAGNATDLADQIEKLQHSISDYSANLAEYIEARRDAVERLRRLERPEESTCLILRYVIGLQWIEVANEMSYTRDGVLKIRNRALVNAWEVMPPEHKDPIPKAY